MTDRWTDRLSEYLDGDLEPDDREALQAHLFTCAECARTLTQLRRVAELARALPDREPPADLWPAIAAAIAEPLLPAEPASGRVPPLRRGRPDGRRRVSVSTPQLAAAALALVLASAGSVWLLRGGAPQADEPPAESRAGSDVRLASTDSGVDGGPPLTGAEVDDAILELEQRLEAGRTRLSPATVRVLEENLRTIDRAVEEARGALAADPANAYVSAHLAATVRRKLELLRRANEIAAAQT